MRPRWPHDRDICCIDTLQLPLAYGIPSPFLFEFQVHKPTIPPTPADAASAE